MTSSIMMFLMKAKLFLIYKAIVMDLKWLTFGINQLKGCLESLRANNLENGANKTEHSSYMPIKLSKTLMKIFRISIQKALFLIIRSKSERSFAIKNGKG
jgi:hypothetical protein